MKPCVGVIIKDKGKRIFNDDLGMTVKFVIHVLKPRSKRKYLSSKQRIVQNHLCGAVFEQIYRFGGKTESFLYSYEWVTTLETLKKARNAFPRIRINYTEEEMEYFRIMKELEEEKKRLTEKEAS